MKLIQIFFTLAAAIFATFTVVEASRSSGLSGLQDVGFDRRGLGGIAASRERRRRFHARRNLVTRAGKPDSPEVARRDPIVNNYPPSSYLNPHNEFRATKGAVSLVWNATLQGGAQYWANLCIWGHSGGPFGENVAAGTGTFTPLSAIALWVREEAIYNPSDPTPSHYTQVVWKGTTQVGCASSVCTDLLGAGTGPTRYHVCEYYPAGNVLTQFTANVDP